MPDLEEEKGSGVVVFPAIARFLLTAALPSQFITFFRSSVTRRSPRFAPSYRSGKERRQVSPSKTVTEQILTNAQDCRPVVQDSVPLADSVEWELDQQQLTTHQP